MEVICLEDAAFYALVEQVVLRIKDTTGVKEDKWISGEEAMSLLRVTSKTTLQKMRDEGKSGFRNLRRKLYCMTGTLFSLI